MDASRMAERLHRLMSSATGGLDAAMDLAQMMVDQGIVEPHTLLEARPKQPQMTWRQALRLQHYTLLGLGEAPPAKTSTYVKDKRAAKPKAWRHTPEWAACYQQLDPQVLTGKENGTWWLWAFVEHVAATEYDARGAFRPGQEGDAWAASLLRQLDDAAFDAPEAGPAWIRMVEMNMAESARFMATQRPQLWSTLQPNGRLLVQQGKPWVLDALSAQPGWDLRAVCVTGEPWWRALLPEHPGPPKRSGEDLRNRVEAWVLDEYLQGRADARMTAYLDDLAQREAAQMLRQCDNVYDFITRMDRYGPNMVPVWLMATVSKKYEVSPKGCPVWASAFARLGQPKRGDPGLSMFWGDQVKRQPAWQALMGDLGDLVLRLHAQLQEGIDPVAALAWPANTRKALAHPQFAACWAALMEGPSVPRKEAQVLMDTLQLDQALPDADPSASKPRVRI